MAGRNRDVAELLEDIANLLEIGGEQPFRVNAYRSAARRIEGLQEDVAVLAEQGRLRQISGVGQALEQKISEYLRTGRLEYYERLRRDLPSGLVTLLDVPGLGPRKARLLYDHLGVQTLGQLEQALEAHQVRTVPGLGARTEDNLLRELARLRQRTSRHALGTALPAAEHLVTQLISSKAVRQSTIAGSLRRMQETVGDVDLVATGPDHDAVADAFVGLPEVEEVLARGPSRCSVLVRGGQQVDLRIVAPEAWGAALIYFTGSKAHNIQLREIAQGKGWKLNEYGLFDDATARRLDAGDEESIYARLGMEWVPPELREDQGEIEAAMRGTLPRLVAVEDLKGDLHCHTNWSDGADSLEAMARAARQRGYEYMAVTDHSKSLAVARGLDEDRLREQRRLVDQLNHELAPFHVLLGTEMDIHRDGRLDYDDETLEGLDYVSASVHSGFGMDEEAMTKRILHAIGDRRVVTLNHPTGRLIKRREGYAVNLDRIIETAARDGVVVEINGQPSRLDLDSRWARRAKEAGARVAINTDSHATVQLGQVRYGLGTARRGWIEPSDVFNALPSAELLAAIRRRRGGG